MIKEKELIDFLTSPELFIYSVLQSFSNASDDVNEQL